MILLLHPQRLRGTFISLISCQMCIGPSLCLKSLVRAVRFLLLLTALLMSSWFRNADSDLSFYHPLCLNILPKKKKWSRRFFVCLASLIRTSWLTLALTPDKHEPRPSKHKTRWTKRRSVALPNPLLWNNGHRSLARPTTMLYICSSASH